MIGGVAISDKIGNTNTTVVHRLCRLDGVLFRPERPAIAMDSTFLGSGGPKGEMWHTYSSDQKQSFFVEYVMITNLTKPYTFSWNELFNTQDDNSMRKISDTYVVLSSSIKDVQSCSYLFNLALWMLDSNIVRFDCYWSHLNILKHLLLGIYF